MKVILFGATGMVGQGVLRECLHDASIESVLTIGRSPTGQTHPTRPTLRELIATDLFEIDAATTDLQGYLQKYDACLQSLEASTSSMAGQSRRCDIPTTVLQTSASRRSRSIDKGSV